MPLLRSHRPTPAPDPPAEPSAEPPAPAAMTPEEVREATLAELRSLRTEIEALDALKEENMPNDPLAGLPADERQAIETYRAAKLQRTQAEIELRDIMRKPNATLTQDELEKLRLYGIEQGRREGWL